MATIPPVPARPRSHLKLPAFVLIALLSVYAASCALHDRSAPTPAATVSEPTDGTAKAEAPPLASSRQLIRTVSLELDVESVAHARKQAEALALSVSGFVESLESTQYAERQQLDLTLRVPREKLDDVLVRVRTLGAVSHESQRVEDVTRKYVDTDARLRNMQKTEQRLLSLLETQSSALADVLAVERELGRVREESEVLDAELRTLKEQVALCTLKLTFVQQADAQAPQSVWTPWRRLGRNVGSILAESLAALLGFGAALVTGLLYALPWTPLFVAVWLFVRFLVRRRRAK